VAGSVVALGCSPPRRALAGRPHRDPSLRVCKLGDGARNDLLHRALGTASRGPWTLGLAARRRGILLGGFELVMVFDSGTRFQAMSRVANPRVLLARGHRECAGLHVTVRELSSPGSRRYSKQDTPARKRSRVLADLEEELRVEGPSPRRPGCETAASIAETRSRRRGR